MLHLLYVLPLLLVARLAAAGEITDFDEFSDNISHSVQHPAGGSAGGSTSSTASIGLETESSEIDIVGPLQIDTFDMASTIARHPTNDRLLLAGAFTAPNYSQQDSGIRIYRVRKDGRLDLKSAIHCPARQSIPALWRNVALQAVDLYSPEPGCDEFAGRFGVRLFDISSPERPRKLGFVELPIGAHQMTVVGDTGLVYIGTDPTHDATQSGFQIGGLPILDIADARHPQLTTLDFGLLDDPVNANMENVSGTTPTSSWCHDIGLDLDRNLAFCAAYNETQIWDISDPRNPVVYAVISNPSISFHHSAVASHDGQILIINDENQATYGTTGGCPPGSAKIGALWFYDISDPTNPVLSGSWAPTDALPGSPSCTSHFFDVFEDRRSLAATWFDYGVFLLDFTDPTQPQVIAHDQPAKASMWDVRIRNGFMYVSSMSPFVERLDQDPTRIGGGGVYVYDIENYEGDGLR